MPYCASFASILRLFNGLSRLQFTSLETLWGDPTVTLLHGEYQLTCPFYYLQITVLFGHHYLLANRRHTDQLLTSACY